MSETSREGNWDGVEPMQSVPDVSASASFLPNNDDAYGIGLSE